MKLTNKEKTELKILISEFESLHTRLDLECTKLETLEEEKKLVSESIEKLANDINGVRNREKELLDRLHEKYGTFILDVETLEIKNS
jgi:hypothetical protein